MVLLTDFFTLHKTYLHHIKLIESILNMKNSINHSPVWAEISIEAITHNLEVIRQLIQPSVKIMAVVKANGYGHGAVTVAHAAKNSGAYACGVARLSEALELRKAGLKLPILIFGFTDPNCTDILISHNLTQTVFSLPYAESLSYHAKKSGKQLNVHLKIDTGMGRLGLSLHQPEDKGQISSRSMETLCKQIHQMCSLVYLEVEGIYTHFAASDSADKSSAMRQLDLFNYVVKSLDANDINIQIKHAANSGAVISLPNAHFDMVRPGIMMYGLYPSTETISKGFQLIPAMQLKTRIAQLKDVQRDFKVSYGQTYSTPKPTKLATIPIGYGDGFSRKLSSLGTMLVRGQRAPVVGRVCMDQTIIDVGHIDSVSLSDEVVVLGQQGDEVLSADEMADHIGTINYEVVTKLMARVPRIIV